MEDLIKFRDELFERYPTIFSDPQDPSIPSVSPLNVCIGEGWHEILHDLCSALEPKVRAWTVQNPDSDAHPRVAQIKEKLGVFCFYMQDIQPKQIGQELYEEIYELTQIATNQSFHICELCGSPAKRRTDLLWIKVLCEDCYLERKEK